MEKCKLCHRQSCKSVSLAETYQIKISGLIPDTRYQMQMLMLMPDKIRSLCNLSGYLSTTADNVSYPGGVAQHICVNLLSIDLN